MSEVVTVAEMALAEGREREALEVLDELCTATHREDLPGDLSRAHRLWRAEPGRRLTRLRRKRHGT